MIKIEIELSTKDVKISGIEKADPLLLGMLKTAARMLSGFGYRVTGIPDEGKRR